MRQHAVTSREKNLADLYMIAEHVRILEQAVQSSPAETDDPELRELVQRAFASLQAACARVDGRGEKHGP